MSAIDPALLAHAQATFRAHFAAEPEALSYAPGRVNLIGEHTDYNDGFVLPMAINYGTVIVGSRNGSGQIRVLAADYDGESDSFAVDAITDAPGIPHWARHIRGIADSVRHAGIELTGCDLAVAGNVPQGAGLSSSASLGVAAAMLLTEFAAAPQLTPVDYAQMAQRSENSFVGTQCGIMDQLIAAAGQASCALRIDCRDLSYAPVPIPPDLAVLIIHSGVERQLASSAYNERRAQCEAVAAHFGVPALRDVSIDQLLGEQEAIAELPFRRARHVLSENARVLAVVAALAAHDIAALSELFRASHQSMRDDFAITVPKIDELVALIDGQVGDSGAVRMTGGGFGGCVVAVLALDRLPDIMAHIAECYRTPSGDRPMMIRAEPSAGAFCTAFPPARSMTKE